MGLEEKFNGSFENTTIAIIGLGYVGLPLAVEFAKHFPVIGFDLNEVRIQCLQEGDDKTQEVSSEDLANAKGIVFTSNDTEMATANIYIVTVPTPIDDNNKPNLAALISASQTVARHLNEGDVVIYESTVFPGATEEVCVPILEGVSGLRLNQEFYIGYSPERINPGDKKRRLVDIQKVTSGSTPEAAEFIDSLYAKIVIAGTYKASSIKVAEAAKVIENTQRDLNIALVNELSIIFRKLDIDTDEVLKAAGTKWNFLPFKPGLVGGHCIGVDPYYLTYRAQRAGYEPDVILSGRRINDGMGKYLAGELVKEMLRKRIQVNDASVLVMGLTFKENCPDIRNTKVIDILSELKEFGVRVDVYDPLVDAAEAKNEYAIELLAEPKGRSYDALVVAVAHNVFIALGGEVKKYLKENHVICDVKCCLPPGMADMRL